MIINKQTTWFALWTLCFNQKFVGAFTLRGLMGSHVRTLDDFSPEDASIVKLKAILDSKVTTSFAAEN